MMSEFLKYYLKGLILFIKLTLLGLFLTVASIPWRFTWEFIEHNFTRHGIGSERLFHFTEWAITLTILPVVLLFIWSLVEETMDGFRNRDSEPGTVGNEGHHRAD